MVAIHCHGLLVGPRLGARHGGDAGPSSAEGLSPEQVNDVPLATVAWVDGCASVGGAKVGPAIG